MSEDQVLKGMVVENFTQRNQDPQELMQNLVMVRDYLKKNKSLAVHPMNSKRKDGQELRPQNIEELGSIRHISQWLDKQTGDVMKVSSIKDYLSIADNLSSALCKVLIIWGLLTKY